MEITVEPVETIRGQIRVPGDKSISHRALLLSSLAEEPVEIEGLLKAADISSTQKCLQDLGTGFVEEKGRLKVSGQGLRVKRAASSLTRGIQGPRHGSGGGCWPASRLSLPSPATNPCAGAP